MFIKCEVNVIETLIFPVSWQDMTELLQWQPKVECIPWNVNILSTTIKRNNINEMRVTPKLITKKTYNLVTSFQAPKM